MAYVLLYVESLAVSLLLVATLVACIGRLRRRRTQVMAFALVLLLLVAVMGFCAHAIWPTYGSRVDDWVYHLVPALTIVLTVGMAAWLLLGRLRRAQVALSVLAAAVPLIIYAGQTGLAAYLKFRHAMAERWFYPGLALTLVYAAGAVWMGRRGLRRAADEPTATRAGGWPRGKLATALGVVAALHLMTFWNIDLSVKHRLAGLGSQAGALALSVAPGRVADSDNAALVYEQAFEIMDSRETIPERYDEWGKWLEPGATGSDWHDPELRTFLGEHAATLALVREAAGKPGCYFEHDYHLPGHYYVMLLPELADLRAAARLLALDARCKAADGKVREALEDVNAMFTLADHQSDTPILIGTLVAIAIDRTAVTTLQTVLTSTQVPADGLAVLDVDHPVSYRKALSRSLRMEEAAQLSLFSRMSSASGLRDAMAMMDARLPNVAALAALYRLFMLNDDLAAQRRFSAQIRRLGIQPYHKAKDDWERMDRDSKALPDGFLTAVLMPGLARCAEVAARADAQRRAVRLALAVHRYRARHGRLPDSFEDLVPEFIVAVPTDPFDGKPMKLKRTDQGLVVYSIGPDMTDDGGSKFDGRKKTGDLTFEIPE